MTFRVSAKLTEDFTMFVNVPRSIKIKFEGLMSKIDSKNHVKKDQGPKHQRLTSFVGQKPPGGPPGAPYAGRDPGPSTENTDSCQFGLIPSCLQL
ncbi:hypothetical protein Hanom_Chr05g00458441 [Helianthus anomalus]